MRALECCNGAVLLTGEIGDETEINVRLRIEWRIAREVFGRVQGIGKSAFAKGATERGLMIAIHLNVEQPA